MTIPKGFIKDESGNYRRGHFLYKEGQIIRETEIVPVTEIRNINGAFATKEECIRAILAFPSCIGEEPRFTAMYVNKVKDGYIPADKLGSDTVAIVTSSRDVIDLDSATIISADEIDKLKNEKAPDEAKEIKTVSSDKPKTIEEVSKAELKEAEGEPIDVEPDYNQILNFLKQNVKDLEQDIREGKGDVKEKKATIRKKESLIDEIEAYLSSKTSVNEADGYDEYRTKLTEKAKTIEKLLKTYNSDAKVDVFVDPTDEERPRVISLRSGRFPAESISRYENDISFDGNIAFDENLNIVATDIKTSSGPNLLNQDFINALNALYTFVKSNGDHWDA